MKIQLERKNWNYLITHLEFKLHLSTQYTFQSRPPLEPWWVFLRWSWRVSGEYRGFRMGRFPLTLTPSTGTYHTRKSTSKYANVNPWIFLFLCWTEVSNPSPLKDNYTKKCFMMSIRSLTKGMRTDKLRILKYYGNEKSIYL